MKTTSFGKFGLINKRGGKQECFPLFLFPADPAGQPPFSLPGIQPGMKKMYIICPPGHRYGKKSDIF